MKFSATLAVAVIASINAEVATAICYGKPGWGVPAGLARDWVKFACKGQNGMFTGNYAPGQTKAMCPGPDNHVLFEVQNQNPTQAFDLGDDDCVQRLQEVMDKCYFGGEISVAGWRFK